MELQQLAGVELNAQRVFVEALLTNAAIPMPDSGNGCRAVWAQKQLAPIAMIMIAMVLKMVQTPLV